MKSKNSTGSFGLYHHTVLLAKLLETRWGYLFRALSSSSGTRGMRRRWIVGLWLSGRRDVQNSSGRLPRAQEGSLSSRGWYAELAFGLLSPEVFIDERNGTRSALACLSNRYTEVTAVKVCRIGRHLHEAGLARRRTFRIRDHVNRPVSTDLPVIRAGYRCAGPFATTLPYRIRFAKSPAGGIANTCLPETGLGPQASVKRVEIFRYSDDK